MTTKYPPLISKADLREVHEANVLNRQVLRAGIRDLVKDVHDGNEQSDRTIRKVADKWIN